MITKNECCLCADKTKVERGERLCVSCLNKAAVFDDLQAKYDDMRAGVDDLRVRMECVGRALRRMLERVKEIIPDDKLQFEIEAQLKCNCAPELALGDARDARITARTREANATNLHHDEVHPTEEAA